MEKFNINDYDINKNYAIEASAGTGKTYNVVNMVKKMINSKVSIKNILIVTYTEKACGELKDRIRKIGNVSESDLNIYTIHSFCQNTIKEFGYSANLSLNLDMEEPDTISRFTSRFIRKGDIFSDINNLIERGYDINCDTLEKDLISGVKKYYLNSSYKEDKDIVLLGSFLDEYNDNFFIQNETIDLSKTIDFLIKIKTCDSVSDFYSIFNNLENCISFFEDSLVEKHHEFIEDLTKLENIRQGFKFNGNKFKGKEFKNLFEFKYIKGLKEFLKDILDHPIKVLFYKYLPLFYKEYDEYKTKNRIESFDDMIRFVREAVVKDNSLLLEKLKEKYKYAIIDEFQDTNQKQFDIFKSIFMSDNNHHIVVVGDPKQSIYSFQGADINVYKKAVEEIRQNGEIKALNKNYRSSCEMVKSCNALFDSYNFNNTNFSHSLFKNKADEDSDVLDTFYLGKKSKAFYVAGNKEKPVNEQEFSRIVCQTIIDMTRSTNSKTKLELVSYNLIEGEYREIKRNVTFKDFTILAKSRSEFVPIKSALKKAGIPFIQYKNGELFSGIECAQLIALLETINAKDFTGDNRRIFNRVLSTYFFGYSLYEINSEYFTHDDNKELELIKKWQGLLNRSTYEALFDSIINDSYLTKNLSGTKNIETLSIFKQIVSYSISFLSKDHNIDELIVKLKGLSNDLEDDEEGALVEKSSDFNAVQLMTIHASKGLQFPIVICVGGFKENPPTKIDIYHTLYPKLIYSSSKLIKEERLEEAKRLYYVAFTRAKNLMIIPRYKDNNDFLFLNESLDNLLDNNSDLIQPLEDNNLKYSDLLKESKLILNNSQKSTFDSSTKEVQEERIKDLIRLESQKSTFKHSYTSLSHPKEDYDISNLEGRDDEGLAQFDLSAKQIDQDYNVSRERSSSYFLNYPKGSTMGTLLHEIFELIDFTNYEQNLDNLINFVFKKYAIDLKEDYIIKTKEIVENTIEAKFSLIEGNKKTNKEIKLLNIDKTNRLSEVEFNFNLIPESLSNFGNGFIDLVFRVGDYYSIIDWKSDNLSESFTSYAKKEDLKNQVDDRYSIQRVLYSYCLISWLAQSYPTLSKEEIFNKHFGGIYYVFIKGCIKDCSNGIYSQTWSSFKDLEKEYKKIIEERILCK